MQNSYSPAKLLGPTPMVIGLLCISLAARAIGSSATAIATAMPMAGAAACPGAISFFGSFR